MAGSRIAVSVLAVLLLAGACGGDDSDEAAEQEDASRSAVAEIAELLDGSRPDPDAAPAPDQQDAPEPEPTATAAGPVRVKLGNRFEWCREVQDVWDRHDELQEAFQRAHTAALEAEALYASSTDELDKAEAREIADETSRLSNELARDYDPAFQAVRRQLGDAAWATVSASDSSLTIAFTRAWQALESNLDSGDRDVLIRNLKTSSPLALRPTETTAAPYRESDDVHEARYSYTVTDPSLPGYLSDDSEIVRLWRALIDARIAADEVFMSKGGKVAVELDGVFLFASATTITAPTTAPVAPEGVDQREYENRLYEERKAALQEAEQEWNMAHQAALNAYREASYQISLDRQAEADRIQIRADEIYRELVSDHPAYTAFRKSLQDSCQ